MLEGCQCKISAECQFRLFHSPLLKNTKLGMYQRSVMLSYQFDFREMIDPNGKKSRQISLNSVDVLGGGRLLLQSDQHGIFMNVTRLKIHTGGKVDATRLHLTAKHIEVAQSGILDLSNKVSLEFLFVHLIRLNFSACVFKIPPRTKF